MLRPGLNKGKVRGGMDDKTEEAEFWKEALERQLETKKRKKRKKREGIREKVG